MQATRPTWREVWHQIRQRILNNLDWVGHLLCLGFHTKCGFDFIARILECANDQPVSDPAEVEWAIATLLTHVKMRVKFALRRVRYLLGHSVYQTSPAPATNAQHISTNRVVNC